MNFTVSYHLVILLSVLLGHWLSGCGSPEVRVDEVRVDYDEKNVDKSKNKTINYGSPKEEVDPEEKSVEAELPLVDMSFTIEVDKIVIAPENFANHYKFYITEYNEQHTSGFRFNISYNNREGTVVDPKAFYDLHLDTNCETYSDTVSRLRWIDVWAINLDGEKSYKVRYEVPFEETWCHTSQLED